MVLAASVSSFSRLRNPDYTVSKHGLLGLMRGVVPLLLSSPPESPAAAIRLNCIAPSWTRSGMVDAVFDEAGYGDRLQDSASAAQSVALLIADGARQGQMVYSRRNRFWETEERFLGLAREIVEVDEDMVSCPPPFRCSSFFLIVSEVTCVRRICFYFNVLNGPGAVS